MLKIGAGAQRAWLDPHAGTGRGPRGPRGPRGRIPTLSGEILGSYGGGGGLGDLEALDKLWECLDMSGHVWTMLVYQDLCSFF